MVESHDGSLSDRASRTPAPLSQGARTLLAARAVCDAAVRPDSCAERFAIPSCGHPRPGSAAERVTGAEPGQDAWARARAPRWVESRQSTRPE